jgi:hypothetical protein
MGLHPVPRYRFIVGASLEVTAAQQIVVLDALVARAAAAAGTSP